MSNRVIKSTKQSDGSSIELFVPPREVVRGRSATPERAVFPRVKKDGTPFGKKELKLPEAGLSDLVLSDLGAPDTDLPDFGPEEELEELLEEEEPDAVEEEVQRILEEARREADELRRDARKRAEEEYESAREAGYRAGYSTGYEESRRRAEGECRMDYEQRVRDFQEDIRRAIRSVEEAKERCLRNYLDELKDCAIAIGEKVIQISLRSSGEVIRQMIISATEKLKKTAWVKIYIDKGDYDMMMEADADIIDELSHLSDNIKFIVMDKEDNGNCIIEMPEEIVDVSVNTQMENIKDILENVRV